eukprot:6175210-Pleurochrysis_carterae.AAC.3
MDKAIRTMKMHDLLTISRRACTFSERVSTSDCRRLREASSSDVAAPPRRANAAAAPPAKLRNG